MSEQEFKEGDLMPWQDMTAKIKELEGIIKTYFSESLSKRIFELEKKVEALAMGDTQPTLHVTLQSLEARVDSLARSLDILQEVIGIDVVTPEGIGELYDEQNIAL